MRQAMEAGTSATERAWLGQSCSLSQSGLPAIGAEHRIQAVAEDGTSPSAKRKSGRRNSFVYLETWRLCQQVRHANLGTLRLSLSLARPLVAKPGAHLEDGSVT